MDRMLLLMEHFLDDEKCIELEKFKPNSTFNPGKK